MSEYLFGPRKPPPPDPLKLALDQTIRDLKGLSSDMRGLNASLSEKVNQLKEKPE